MVSSVKPRYRKAAALENVLRQLNTLLQSLKPIAPVAPDQAANAIQKAYSAAGKVGIPYSDPKPRPDAQYKLAFEAPTALQVIGSWPLKAIAQRPGGFDVDLAVVMPSSLFQEKDHLNYRYFHKRAFYLATLAAALTASKKQTGVEVEYGLESDDPRRPLLVLKPICDQGPSDFSKLKAEIRIHLAHDPELFPPARLAPSRNNIRNGKDDEASTSTNPAVQQPATPRYNAAILSDSLRTSHLIYLHNIAKSCPAFNDACMLLKVWSYQRGLGSGQSASSAKGSAAATQRWQAMGSGNARFFLTMVLAHLLSGEEKAAGRGSSRAKLNHGFSSYQLFRGALDWLATQDFHSNPVFMKSAPEAGLSSRSDKVPREDFAHCFDGVMVEPSGSLNLLAEWTPGSLEFLQQEAKTSFALLDDAEADHFDTVFLTPKSCPSLTLDDVFWLPVPPPKDRIKQLDFGSIDATSATAIQTTCTKALAARVAFATVFTPALVPNAGIHSAQFSPRKELAVGLRYNGAQALRLVEHGPTPEDKEAAADFQQFWGDIAELRRFKDGRILLSIVWEIEKQSERWAIPRKILQYALARHHEGLQASFQGDGFAGMLEAPQSVVQQAYLTSPETKGFQLVQSTFDSLVRELRASEDLPLSLVSIVPNSAALRSTSTFVPAPIDLGSLGTARVPDCLSYLPVQDIVLTFESSGKWPDELKAIQAMKLAFFEKMAVILPQKIDGLQAQVALDLDADESELQDQASLEIIHPSGYAFRARIHHEREKVLLGRLVADKLGESIARREEAARALARWQKRFVIGPRHHAAISTLTHRYAAFSETVRLLKRWVRSHMLDGAGHVPSETLELLTASTYICPGAAVPSTGHAGLIRVLARLSSWKWREEPLLVPVQNALSASDQQQQLQEEKGSGLRFPSEQRQDAVEAFKLARSQDPSLNTRAWFFATEDDVESMSFSTAGPSGATAHALQTLAQAALHLLSSQQHVDKRLVQGVFTASRTTFDFVLHLDPAYLPRYGPHHRGADERYWSSQTKGGFKNAVSRSRSTIADSRLGSRPRPGFEPAALFVSLLRSIFADSLRLYFDPHGAPLIGGIFNPLLLKDARRFKVGLGFNSEPVESQQGQTDERVRLNSKAVLAEIARLGEGLVTRVEVKSS